MTTRLNESREGLVVAIPLARRGGYGRFVVAREEPKRGKIPRIVLCYCFGPRVKRRMRMGDVELHPRDVAAIKWASDMYLLDGNWKALGRVIGFNRDEWPVPDFKHWDHIATKFERITYDKVTLKANYSRIKFISDREAAELPWDGLSGSGALEYFADDAIDAQERGVPLNPGWPDGPPPSRLLMPKNSH